MTVSHYRSIYTRYNPPQQGRKLWIRQRLSKFNYWLSQNYHPDSTGLNEILGVLTSLDVELFRDYDMLKACTFEMETEFPNLEDYNTHLRLANHILASKGKIDPQWVVYDKKPTNLCQFLIKQGKHLPPQETIATFKARALQFLEHYHAIRNDQIGDSGYNKRIMEKFRTSVLSVSHLLLRYSHGGS